MYSDFLCLSKLLKYVDLLTKYGCNSPPHLATAIHIITYRDFFLPALRHHICFHSVCKLFDDVRHAEFDTFDAKILDARARFCYRTELKENIVLIRRRLQFVKIHQKAI